MITPLQQPTDGGRSQAAHGLPPAIAAHDLTVRFGKFVAVDGVNLQVGAGQVLGLLGPNGAGKTTIVRALATLQRITSGRAEVFGIDVTTQAVQARSLIGLTGQYASVDEDLTARENLQLFGKLFGFSRAQATRRANELLEEFSLTEAATRPIKGFSGGMRRRLDLAASLIASPPLIFLDEPTTGLDPRTRVAMWETVRRLVKDGSTILLTTQYLEEADELADHIAVIDRGRIVAEGTSDELKSLVAEAQLRLVAAPGSAPSAIARVVEQVLGSGTVETNGRIISAPVTDTSVTADVLIALREVDLHVDEVTVQRPSLDDVFFALTGRHTEGGNDLISTQEAS